MTVRVLLVDDSATFRAFCRAQLEAAGFDVVGEATTGRDGLEMTQRLRPSVVLMDVEMPEMDGYEATREIMDRAPTPVVVVTATTSGRGVRLSVESLEAGALSAMLKPTGLDDPDFAKSWARLGRTLRAMASVHVVRRRRARFSRPPRSRRPERAAEVVALAASTGGPAALRELLGALPENFGAPLLIVQHIGDEFVAGFADWLDRVLPLQVSLARDGDELRTGRVYIAPEAKHLTVRSGRVSLRDSAPIGGFRPSANALFASVADDFGARALGVILTGMGSDGLDGLRRLHAQGGHIVAQDEATSVVHSMPGHAVRAGIAHEVLPLHDIASHLQESVK